MPLPYTRTDPPFSFWAVKNAAPSALGSKEIPAGVENSLAGKTFVLTGQLSSITRDDTADLIKRCGGYLRFPSTNTG